VIMKQRAWRILWVVAAIGLAGCASSGGPATAVATPDIQAPPEEAGPQESPAVPDDRAPVEEPLENRLKWSTATEVDNFGFDIYRSTSEDGPFDRITSQPIPGAGTVDEPSYYEFVDDTIDPGVDYYYYVESISVDGIRETFSPIIRAPAKHPSSEGASE